MKVIKLYEKVGDVLKLSKNSMFGEYCFRGEPAVNGRLIFKDEESFTKRWDEPCYIPASVFEDGGTQYTMTDKYETHKTLLEKCNYNERMCQCMFERIDCWHPEEWLDDLDEDDYAYFYDFVKVGNDVFLNEPPFKSIPMQYGNVVAISTTPDNWTFDTSIDLKVRDVIGEVWTIEAYLHEVSETDIKLKMKRWEK